MSELKLPIEINAGPFAVLLTSDGLDQEKTVHDVEVFCDQVTRAHLMTFEKGPLLRCKKAGTNCRRFGVNCSHHLFRNR